MPATAMATTTPTGSKSGSAINHRGDPVKDRGHSTGLYPTKWAIETPPFRLKQRAFVP